MTYQRYSSSDPVVDLSDNSLRLLNYHDTYPCPVCGYGELAVLVLTEAFACSFCRHIFSTDLQAQSVEMLDGAQPKTWFWTGERWKYAMQADSQVTAVVWSVALAISCVPALLVMLSNYMFPPIDSDGLNQFAFIWTGATLLAHGGIVTWLLAEYYQWPWYVMTKIKLGR